MPVDLDEAPLETEGMSVEERREARRGWKNRKARARKLAVEKVRSGVESWEMSFRGGEGMYGKKRTKYFRVGTVGFGEEDLEVRKRRPVPKLCEAAVASRPKHAADLGIL